LFREATCAAPLACAVACSCRQDVVARVASLLELSCAGKSPEPPFEALAQVGAGAVEADLAGLWGARLLMASEAVSRWRKGPRVRRQFALEPLVSAIEASGNRPVMLDVELEGCELEVGALQGLQVGDVVRLSHGLQSPASVRHAGMSFCSAYLGRRGGRKAVELAGRARPAAGEVAR